MPRQTGASLPPRSSHHAPRAHCMRLRQLLLSGLTSRAAVAARCSTSSALSSSYFEVLGVSESATLEEIKAAFRAKSKMLHPDINKAPNAAWDFMQLRRAYTTLTTAELRAEYEAKLGMPSARACDPRFARFERWRREVVPDLQIQLDNWSRGLDGFLAAWRASVDEREQNLARLHRACVESLQQLQRLLDAERKGRHPPPQSPQHQPAEFWLQKEDGSAPMASAASADSSNDGEGRGGSGEGVRTAAQVVQEDQLTAAVAAAIRDMAAEVAGIVSDAGDGTARVEREVEKRYQQVSMRYPAYPDIVWIDVWEDASEQWLAQSAAEAQRCTEARSRWSSRLEQLQAWLQAATPPELGHGQVAGAGTGRFNAG